MNFTESIKNAELGKLHLFYAGQAGFVIKSPSGKTLAIDLYLSDCVEKMDKNMGVKRLLSKIMSPDEMEFDYIIATHPHLDHFDIDSIPDMMRDNRTQLFASMDCKQYEKEYSLDVNRITYVAPGDECDADDIRLRFVNCDHGTGAPDAVGVIFEVAGKRIYMAGDTCLRLDRVEEYTKFGPIDVLIGPINGAYGNMNEEDYVNLSDAIKPKMTIPCHYGMFASHGGSTGKFLELMEGKSGAYIMTVGECLTL